MPLTTLGSQIHHLGIESVPTVTLASLKKFLAKNAEKNRYAKIVRLLTIPSQVFTHHLILKNIFGPTDSRKKLLLRYFGSLEQIKRASVDDLSEVSGIGRITAKSIYKQLHK